MYEAGLLLAAGVGFLSLLLGSRTAIPLLASFGLSYFLCWLQVPFDPFLWMTIDMAVILCIVHSRMTHADVAVLALFIPAWFAYWLPPETRNAIVWTVMVGQFLLVFPPHKACLTIQRFTGKGKSNDNLEFAHV